MTWGLLFLHARKNRGSADAPIEDQTARDGARKEASARQPVDDSEGRWLQQM